MRILSVLFAIAICISPVYGQTDSLLFYVNQGLEQKEKGSHAEAKSSLEKAVNFIGADSTTAVAYHQLGNLDYRSSQYTQAIHHWENAIMHRKNYLAQNHVDIIKTYINIGNAENILGNTRRSHKALSTALDLLNSQNSEDTFRKANVYDALGRLEKNELNLNLALSYLQEAYRLYAQCDRDIKWRQVNTCTDLFDSYKILHNPTQALLWAEKALQEVKKINPTQKNYDIYLANALCNRGIAHKLNFQYKEAEQDYIKALILNNKLSGRTAYAGVVLNNLVALYAKMNDIEKVEAVLQQARIIFTQNNQTQLLANTLIEEAKFRYDQTDYSGAIATYDEAKQSLSKQKSEQISDLIRTAVNEATVVELVTGQLKSKLALYRVNKDLSILSDVDEQIDDLAQMIDKISIGMSDLESKLEFSELVDDFFDVALSIKFLQYRESSESSFGKEAWYLMDKAKSRTILDNLRLDHISKNSERLSEQYETRKTVQDQIYQYSTIPPTLNVTPSQDTIMKLQAHAAQIDFVIDSLLQDDNVWSRDSKKNDLNTVAPETLVMQYYMADDSSFVISSYQGHIHFENLGATIDIEHQLEKFIAVLKNPSIEAKLYHSTARDVFNLLFPSRYKSEIPNSIIIIPDRLIGKIPFEALLATPTTDQYSFLVFDYLMRHCEISYASSVGILNFQIQNKRNIQNKAVGFAIDYTDFPIGEYSILVNSLEELESLQSFTNQQSFVQTDATATQFFVEAERASLIHLSLHGVSHHQKPDLSYLQFYPEDTHDEGKVFLKDIYHKDINPALVVLSSCSSGDGYLSEAEGSISFAHAFSYSQSQSILLNLWDSASSSSIELIQRFYQQLFKGASKSKSLQQAKIDYLNTIKAQELAHPFYWATLVIYGNPDSMDFGFSFLDSSVVWLLIPSFLIGIYFILRKRLAASS